jgi:phospholipase/carboxylesterase
MSFSRIPTLVCVLAAIAAVSTGCDRGEQRSAPPARNSKNGRKHAIRHHPLPARTDASAPDASAAPAADGTRTVAGLRYVELVTGGAAEGDALPLIAFFHGEGGKPEALREKLATFKEKARIILPYGIHAADNGDLAWFAGDAADAGGSAPRPPGQSSKPEAQEKYAQAIPATEDAVAAALAAIAKERPTMGKPIAAGFAQGAGLTLALALRHPDLLAAACPMAGDVPAQVFAGVKPPATKPELHAFIGEADPGGAGAKRSIESFKALGYVADIKILPGVGHTFGPAADEVLGCLERALHLVK